jgi:hypothetical protein
MKRTKQLRRQALEAQRVAIHAADSIVADELKTLALAFQAQAEVLQRKKREARKKKVKRTLVAKAKVKDPPKRKKRK